MPSPIAEAGKSCLLAALGFLVAGAAVATLSIIGLVFIWQALQAWLVTEVGTVGALLISGTAALLAAFCVLLAIHRSRRARRPIAADRETAASQHAFALGLLAIEALRAKVKANPGKAAVIAAIAGAVLGANPRLARAFVQLAKQLESAEDGGRR